MGEPTGAADPQVAIAGRSRVAGRLRDSLVPAIVVEITNPATIVAAGMKGKAHCEPARPRDDVISSHSNQYRDLDRLPPAPGVKSDEALVRMSQFPMRHIQRFPPRPRSAHDYHMA